MAIIKCNECGKEISTTAENCPYCGYRTAHGRSVSEAKGYLIWGVIALILLFVGFVMVMTNAERFFELQEYSDYRKYFSEDDKKVVRSFWIGVFLLISSVVDACIVWSKMKAIRDSGDNGFLEEGIGVYGSTEWNCKRCGVTNSGKADRCVRCGLDRWNRAPTVEQKIPAWKRVEMEAQKAAEAGKDSLTQSEQEYGGRFCVSCGQKVQPGQTFCGGCGIRL